MDMTSKIHTLGVGAALAANAVNQCAPLVLNGGIGVARPRVDQRGRKVHQVFGNTLNTTIEKLTEMLAACV
jgi:hypothetical protein